MKQPPEQWKAIVGYERSYEVSSLGRVKSLARKVGNRFMEECIMRFGQVHSRGQDSNPYPVVWLRRPGESKKHFVHRLVAEAFLERPENSEMVNHKNGDKNDARVENLEWCTFQENSRHYHDELKPRHAIDLNTDTLKVVLSGIEYTPEEAINPDDLPW